MKTTAEFWIPSEPVESANAMIGYLTNLADAVTIIERYATSGTAFKLALVTLDEEQIDFMRTTAILLGIEILVVTPARSYA